VNTIDYLNGLASLTVVLSDQDGLGWKTYRLAKEEGIQDAHPAGRDRE
jgi:hypothetical protein